MAKPGDSITTEFVTSSSTGAATNADSLPTATLARNGTDDGTVTVTVTNIDAGRYKAAFTLPSGYAAGDETVLIVSATIGGIAAKAKVWEAQLDSARFADVPAVNTTKLAGQTVAASGTVTFAAGTLPTVGTGANQIAVDGTGKVTVGTNADKTGYTLSQSFPTNFGSLAIAASTGYVTVGTNTDKTGYTLSQSFPTNFGALAITGGGAVTAGTVSDKTGYALTTGEHTNIAGDVLSAVASGYNVAGTIGNKINSAASAGDPWTASLPGSYSAGQAGYIVGNGLNAKVGDVKAKTDLIGTNAADSPNEVTTQGLVSGISGTLASVNTTVGVTGATVATNLDAKVSSRLASTSYTIPPIDAATGLMLSKVREDMAQALYREDCSRLPIGSTPSGWTQISGAAALQIALIAGSASADNKTGGIGGRVLVPVTKTNLDVSIFTNVTPLVNQSFRGWSIVRNATSAADTLAPIVRASADGQNFYTVFPIWGVPHAECWKRSAGTYFPVGTQPAIPLFADGEIVNWRVDISGTSTTTISYKVWPKGEDEPAAWTVTWTDSSSPVTGAGTFGAIVVSPGTGQPNVAGLWFGEPSAQWKEPTEYQVLCTGNSIMAGYLNTASPATSMADYLGSRFLVRNLAITGQTTTTMIANDPAKVSGRINPGVMRPVVVGQEILNDYLGPAAKNWQAAVANWVTYCQTIRALGVPVITIPVMPVPSADMSESDRQSINNYLAQNWSSFCDGYVAALESTSVLGAAGANTNATYYHSSDQVHWTSLADQIAAVIEGNAVLQFFGGAAGVVNADATVSSRATPGAQMDLVNSPNATAITVIQSGLATAASLAGLIAKFTGITSVGNWLRALMRKDAPDATALGEINATTNSINGTYAAPNDSTQAIRERGDAAWVSGSGGGGGSGLSGPSSVTLTFHDASGVAMSNVEFTIVGQGTMRANSSGVAAFGMVDGIYTVTASQVGLVMFADTALTVSGTTALTITGTAIAITTPSDPGQTTGYLTTRDGQGAAAAGVVVTFRLKDPAAATDGFARSAFTATSDGSGLLQVPLRKATAYQGRIDKGAWVDFTTDGGSSFELPEMLGALGT